MTISARNPPSAAPAAAGLAVSGDVIDAVMANVDAGGLERGVDAASELDSAQQCFQLGGTVGAFMGRSGRIDVETGLQIASDSRNGGVRCQGAGDTAG